MKLTRTIIIGSMAIALLAGCGGAGGRGKEEERLVQSVEVYSVRLDTVVRTVQLLGTLQGDQQAMAMPKFAGRVTEVVKPEGSNVNEGDPIAYVVNDVPGMDFKPGPVTAPVSGTVGKVFVEVGQSVAPGMCVPRQRPVTIRGGMGSIGSLNMAHSALARGSMRSVLKVRPGSDLARRYPLCPSASRPRAPPRGRSAFKGIAGSATRVAVGT